MRNAGRGGFPANQSINQSINAGTDGVIWQKLFVQHCRIITPRLRPQTVYSVKYGRNSVSKSEGF